jgi:hypothetical protein
MSATKTLFDKVWDSHVVHKIQDGPDVLFIDRHMVHEVTSPVAFLGIKNRNIPVMHPEKTFATADHNTPTINQHLPVADPLSANQLKMLEENANEYGISYWGLGHAKNGIVHVVGPEYGITQPGATIVCGDSHTSTHGAFGAIAFGIGTSEVEMEKASSEDLDQFKEVWLKGKKFPMEEAKDYLLKKSLSHRMYYVLKHEDKNTFTSTDILKHPKLSTQTKLELLDRKSDFSDQELTYLIASNDIKIRQFAAQKMVEIPLALKELAESLLLDDSYITNEIMLYNLWSSFDYDRITYLEKTKDIVGLPNKNVRLLWLTLALVTPDYNTQESGIYFEELIGYTSSMYNPEVRQTAFQYLFEIQALKGEGLVNLIKASNHHSWQFRNYARQLLDSLLMMESQKNEIEKIATQLNSSDLRYLKTKLSIK